MPISCICGRKCISFSSDLDDTSLVSDTFERLEHFEEEYCQEALENDFEGGEGESQTEISPSTSEGSDNDDQENDDLISCTM